jgi:hypothetical protein
MPLETDGPKNKSPSAECGDCGDEWSLINPRVHQPNPCGDAGRTKYGADVTDIDTWVRQQLYVAR